MNTSEITMLQLKKDASIKEAMKQLNISSWKILFLVDNKQRFIGTVTDGDIRRWILNNGSLDAKAELICKRKAVYVEDKKYDMEAVKDIMVNRKIEAIPVVDNNMVICNVLFWEDVFGQKYKKSKAKLNIPVVIMAGGKGERMSFLEKIFPKPLIPVGEKPVIELVMDSFYENGCNEFYLILHHKAEVIKSYFNSTRLSYGIHYIEEEKPLGTVGGLRLLPKDFSDTLFLCNCDIIIKEGYEEMFKFHKSYKNDITIMASYKHFRIPYGVIEIDKDSKNNGSGKVKDIVEKPEHDHLVLIGMYIIEKKALDLIPPNETFDMPDFIKKAKKEGLRVGVYPINERSWTDIGELEKYKDAVKKFGI